ncbi:MAG: hypothetical protein ACJASQ_001708 [Crocinitomicaceae bacterium]|jgi:uncharacterized protein YbbC (DUF1343 family)
MKYSYDKFNLGFWLNYTKDLCLKSIFILLIFSCEQAEATIPSTDPPVKILPKEPTITAASYPETYMPLLEGKKVGIVGNQTSMVDETHLVDTMIASGINVIRVFSPEHGFRGDADAGELVGNQKDEKTGLPIISLYGKNKKPYKSQLEGLDIVVFDIQDVGVRFYTYISTLHYVMEACAENNIPLMILDRPNPNGHYVDGPVLDTKYKSFVGMHPVPIVHGMTIGEYGKMINGEKWLKGGVECDLTVIPCSKLYSHAYRWWVNIPPSPNLRSQLSISVYPSLCLLEATDVTVGRGTDGPFERFGHPNFPDSLGFNFTPEPNLGAKYPKHKGKKCYGFDLNEDVMNLRMDKMDLSFLIEANNYMKGDMFLGKKKDMFHLLAGNGVLLEQVKKGMTEDQIRETWKEDLDAYKLIREKYLIYGLGAE